MKKLLLILFSFFALTVYSQEVISEFTKETLPVLNEELRLLNEDTDFTGDVTGSGKKDIALTIGTGAVGADELASTAVTAGNYTLTNLTVDADGRITTASNGTALTSVSQGDLNTTTGEVSLNFGVWAISNLTLPGGGYGFYPQVKAITGVPTPTGVKVFAMIDGAPTAVNAWNCRNAGDSPAENYTTRITLGGERGGTGDAHIYARQRYITASGHDHWIFLLVDKTTKKVISGYQAPDHPSANQGGATEIEIPHPFGSYDPDKHEIVVVDNADLPAMRARVTRKKSLLTVINEDYEIDNDRRPFWTPREIVKIDEYGDLPGETIRRIKTPEWAKIMLNANEITLKRRMVNELPNYIKYRKMKLKEAL